MQLTRYKEDCYHNNKHWNAHESKWKAPLEADVAVADAEIDPVRKEDAQKVGNKYEGESRASVMGF